MELRNVFARKGGWIWSQEPCREGGFCDRKLMRCHLENAIVIGVSACASSKSAIKKVDARRWIVCRFVLWGCEGLQNEDRENLSLVKAAKDFPGQASNCIF